jgi:hypothetical protein
MKSVDLFSASDPQSGLPPVPQSAPELDVERKGLWLRQSYLGAWFQTLKQSAHYTQMARTGMFPSQAGYETYLLFGAIEDLSFEQWWVLRGRSSFGSGEFPLNPGCLVQYKAEQDAFRVSFCFTTQAYAAGSRLMDALALARCACTKVLSFRPVTWPFFTSRVSAAAVFRSLDVVHACSAVGRCGQIKLYEIGERLKLSSAVIGQPGDRGLVLADKHAAMSKLVSAERRRGLALTSNAARGVFPSYSVCD